VSSEIMYFEHTMNSQEWRGTCQHWLLAAWDFSML